MPWSVTPHRAPTRPVPEVRALDAGAVGQRIAKRWLLGLLEGAPLAAVPALAGGGLAERAPVLAAALVEAAGSDHALARLGPGGSRALLGADLRGPLAAEGSPGPIAALEVLRAVATAELLAALGRVQDGVATELTERVAHTTAVLAAQVAGERLRAQDDAVMLARDGTLRRACDEPDPQPAPEATAPEDPATPEPPAAPPPPVQPDPAAPSEPAGRVASPDPAAPSERVAPPDPAAPDAESVARGVGPLNGDTGLDRLATLEERAGVHDLAVRRAERRAGRREEDPPTGEVVPDPLGPASWQEAVEQRIASGDGRSFAVLLAELDGAERLAQAEEDAGARLFAAVGQGLRGRLRSRDLLAYEEGGRMWVLAAGARRSGAHALAMRLADLIAAADAPHGVPLRASIGFAIFPQDGTDAAMLAEVAEEDLMRARADGVTVVRGTDEQDD